MPSELDKSHTRESLLKWILGGVGAGLVAIGIFAQVAFNAFMARSNAEVAFFREDLKASLGAIAKASTDTSAEQRATTRVLEASVAEQRTANAEQRDTKRVLEDQTRILKQIEYGQAKGVWRTADPPPAKETPP